MTADKVPDAIKEKSTVLIMGIIAIGKACVESIFKIKACWL